MHVQIPIGRETGLRLRPYIMYSSSEYSGETARMRRLFWAISARLCDTESKKAHKLDSKTLAIWILSRNELKFRIKQSPPKPMV